MVPSFGSARLLDLLELVQTLRSPSVRLVEQLVDLLRHIGRVLVLNANLLTVAALVPNVLHIYN